MRCHFNVHNSTLFCKAVKNKQRVKLEKQPNSTLYQKRIYTEIGVYITLEGFDLMPIEFDNERHCKDFIRLNEQWITEHFSIEEADHKLAANPFQIVHNGGHIISLVEGSRVVGVCALFKESPQCYQLARMAVEPGERGKGYGNILIRAALERVRESGASRVYLHSNTVLAPAIALYRKHGFNTFTEGQHPVYARSNIVMELLLPNDTQENQHVSAAF